MSTLLDSARVERIGGSLSRIAGQRKVRTPTGSRLDNVQARRRDGKCNREQTADRPDAERKQSGGEEARVKRCGKSAPRTARAGRHGKPPAEQDQIGKQWNRPFPL